MYQDNSQRKFEYMGDAIRIYRNRKKMHRHDLAAKAEVSLSHLQNIEYGKTNPTLPIIERICWALEINPLVILSEYFKAEMEEYKYVTRMSGEQKTLRKNHLARGGKGDKIEVSDKYVNKNKIVQTYKLYNVTEEGRRWLCKKETCKKHWQCCSP